MMKHLLAAAILSQVPLAAYAQPPVEKGDQDLYIQAGSCWGAYNAPWSTYGKATPRRGLDYYDKLFVYPGSFPNKTLFTTYAPSTLPPSGVFGYNQLSYGDYDAGPTKGCVTPRQIKAVTSLSVSYDVNWYFALGDFNILSEMYAYAGPTSATAKKLEIGFLVRPSVAGTNFAKAGKSLGKFTDAFGAAWPAWQQGTYVMFLGESRPAGKLDYLGALRWLQAKGLLTGDEYFNGLAFGVETQYGAVTLNVNSLGVTYR